MASQHLSNVCDRHSSSRSTRCTCLDASFYSTRRAIKLTKSYAGESDYDENKFIRFKTLDDLVAANWTDLSSLVPSGVTPYYLTVKEGKLYLAIFNHESPGSGDSILQLTPLMTPAYPVNENQPNKVLKATR